MAPRAEMPAGEGSALGDRRLPVAVVLAAAAGHAILFYLAFPPAGLWPLTFVAATPLVWLAVAAPPSRRTLLIVFGVQLVMWLVISRWVAAVTAVGYPFLCAYLALYGVAFVWLLGRLARARLTAAWPLAVLAPLAWVAVEFLRGRVLFHGYPWYLAGHPVAEWTAAAQSADLLGTYFVGFLAVMPAGLVVDALRDRSRARRRVAASAGIVAGAVVANLLYGVVRLAPAPGAGPVVLALQTNLPQDNKIVWAREDQRRDVAAFIDQTTRAVEALDTPPDLVVWPETMLPGFGLEPGTVATLLEGPYYPADLYSAAVEDLVESLGTPMLVGSPAYLGLRLEPTGDGDEARWAWDTQHNSAYLVDGEPPYQRYDKVFLTPFGETMPYISAWPWLERKLLALGARGMRFELDAADEPVRLELARAGRTLVMATPICFEDTVPRLCRRMVYEDGRKRVDLLVNLSNDGWFGTDAGARTHHAQIARFRCIESRVPMVRAVNTGLSVAVDSRGRLIGSVGEGRYGRAGRAGTLVAELPLDSRSTLYGRVGELWAWACLAAAGLAAAGPPRRKGSTG